MAEDKSITDGRDKKGKFTKGHKYVGLIKGTGRPGTNYLRSLVKDLTLDTYNDFKMSLTQLEPKDFCQVWVQLLKYNLPALQAVQIEDITKEKDSFAIRLKRLAEQNEK